MALPRVQLNRHGRLVFIRDKTKLRYLHATRLDVRDFSVRKSILGLCLGAFRGSWCAHAAKLSLSVQGGS